MSFNALNINDNMVSATACLMRKKNRKNYVNSQEAIKGFPNNGLEDARSFPQQIYQQTQGQRLMTREALLCFLAQRERQPGQRFGHIERLK